MSEFHWAGELLRVLAQNPGRVLTHRFVLSPMLGRERVDDSHTLRVFIANLRGKIERDPAHPRLIRNETRVGYRFSPDE